MRVTSAHRFGTSQPRHVTGSVKRLFAPHETLGEFVENTVCIDGEQDAYQRLSRGATLGVVTVPISADHFSAPTNSVRVVVSAQGQRVMRLREVNVS